MNIPLPEAVTTFFEISNGAEPSRVAECFAKDARVIDEERTHHGIKAIESWQRQVREASSFTVTLLNVSSAGDRLTVETRVAGDFPGSPLELDHVFVLKDDRIQSLEISP